MFSKKKLLFLGIFIAIALAAQRINFSSVVGANNQYFTLFQFFGPIAGSFLGAFFGIFSILAAEIIHLFWAGNGFNWINLFRLTPMLFAAYYFGTKGKKSITVAIPVICMALFMLHPVGQGAWFFSLYWLIPVIVKVLPKKYSEMVFLRSLGATFTAHAIGSTVWLYTVPMTSGQWVGLVPVVAYERLLFAAGITVSYIAMNNVLARLSDKTKADAIETDKRYLITKKLFRHNA